MAVVLVVDDEFGIVKLLEEVLTDEGHRVVIATNGQQALERAAKEKPSLVVTDFMMPVMDGAALVKAMRADPQLADVPVVIMSSMPGSDGGRALPRLCRLRAQALQHLRRRRPRRRADQGLKSFPSCAKRGEVAPPAERARGRRRISHEPH